MRIQENLPNAVTTGFNCKVNFLWRYFDVSPEGDDWPCPERTVVELTYTKNQKGLNGLKV